MLAAFTHPSHIVIYTRHLSSCLFVGCTHSPRLHSYLCSRGFAPLPSRSILKSIGYMLLGIRSLAVALHLEIYWVYFVFSKAIKPALFYNN
ncbi:conserved hypothetical protein [Photorhabdus asymbiotica]|uniref:Uncharacterized protein n=1 Tax=Photorhabdus asymbiotica subsp. asymbiotica (strain ATCC 43949 / 3105-77) TaxID=553480 RepID=B6VMU6_PHOAA|nr:conserved hypothetical protein [Photorhabdus asymbiotica]CAR67476.1 Hypothetical Protein PA-RVA14-1100 [Photorhabdus asymbiotica subsp. asymbiotica ATCC 43949]